MATKKPRIGRPPRTDRPAKVMVVLPGAVRAWLKRRAQREGCTQSDIVVAGLALYRRRHR